MRYGPLLAAALAAVLVGAAARGEPYPADPLAPDLSEFEPGVREAISAGLEAWAGREEGAEGAAWGELGMLYQAHHLPAMAEACYREAVAAEPDRFRWRYLLAFVLGEQGEWRDAAGAYGEALALDPDYLPARLRRARALLAAQDPDAARAGFEEALRRDPGNAAALAGLGTLAHAQGRHAEAVRLLEAALTADPRATRLHHPLGMSYRELGEIEQARRHLAARGAAEPVFPDPVLAEVAGRSRSAQLFLERGYAAARAGRLDEAVEAFTRAVGVAPEDATARVSLGQGLTMAGKPEAALPQLEEAVRLDPGNAHARYRRGIALEMLGRDDEAVEDYRAMLAAEPGHPQAALRLGDALMRKGRPAAAAEAYGAAELPAGEGALARYRQALALLAAGDCAGAIPVLEQALEESPGQGEIYQALARAYATCPAADEAGKARGLALAERLFAARADAAHAETLAMARAAAGDFGAAAALQFQVAEAASGGDPRVLAWRRSLLERYRDGLPADRPWPEWHPAFRPAPTGAGPGSPGGR